jgi:hypothetical protein
MNSVERIYREFQDHFEQELESTRDTKTRRALRHAIRRCKHMIDEQRARHIHQAEEKSA